MYKIIHGIVTNKYLNICLAIVLIYSGFNEAWETLADDLENLNLQGHHGVFLIGIMHLLKSLEEVVKGLEKIDEAHEGEEVNRSHPR